MAKKLEDYITSVPDYPRKGVLYRDITAVIGNPEGFSMTVNGLVERLKDVDFDLIVSAESRGFVFAAPVAYAMHKGFVLARKKGKLPRETVSEAYDLEYGTATIEIHKNSIRPGQKVVIVDDLVATGGTTKAVTNLIKQLGGNIVKIVFVIELAGFEARTKTLKDYNMEALLTYPGK